MKKSLIALAVLATAGTAFAQSSVTLSGNIATQYSRTTTAGTSAALNDGGAGNTGFALSGTEDLGGGLKATVYMQQRFNSVTGENVNTSDKGVQNINVGLSGAFGAVRVGRIDPGSLSGFDAFGGYNEGYAKAYKVSQRKDSLIQYTSPTISGFAVSVASTNTTGEAKEYNYIQAKYSNGPLSLGIAQDKNGAAAGDKQLDIGGSYTVSGLTVMVLNGKTTPSGGASVSNTSIGVKYPMGAMTFMASFRSGDTDDQTAVGVDYALSKRTGLYAAAMSDSAATTQTAFRLGIKHSF